LAPHIPGSTYEDPPPEVFNSYQLSKNAYKAVASKHKLEKSGDKDFEIKEVSF